MAKIPCSVEFLRGILLLLNIIFVLVGIAIIGIGIYITIDSNFSAILNKLTSVSSFEGQSLGFLAFVLIGGGVLTLLIALFGCMGSLWHNRCLLYIYGIVLGVLMILQLVGFILAITYSDTPDDVYKSSLLTVFTNALNATDTKVLNAFHELEKALHCCGVTGIADYDGKDPAPDCFRYRKGCSGAIIDLITEKLPIIGVTLGVVLLFELIGLIVAVLLAIGLKNEPDKIYSSNPGKVLHNIVSTPRRYNRI